MYLNLGSHLAKFHHELRDWRLIYVLWISSFLRLLRVEVSVCVLLLKVFWSDKNFFHFHLREFWDVIVKRTRHRPIEIECCRKLSVWVDQWFDFGCWLSITNDTATDLL